MNHQKNLASRLTLTLLCAAAMLCGVLDRLYPDRIAVRPEEAAAAIVRMGGEADTAVDCAGDGTGSDACTITCKARLFGLIPVKSVDIAVLGDVRLIPGGVPFGVKLYSEGVIVMGVGDVPCEEGRVSPAKDAGIMERDIICAIDGSRVYTAEEIMALVHAGGGRTMTLTVKRQGDLLDVDVTPVRSAEDGKYRAGLLIRDSTAGIGTVTYIEPDTCYFAGLGHGICDGETGRLLPLTRGTIVNVAVSGVVKGQAGCPGELKGYFSSGKIGTLLGNNECGVYGIFAELPAGCPCDAVPIALSGEIREGEAELWCTVDGSGMKAYRVNITNIDRSGKPVKNFVVNVVDPILLERTGGIVQGMSGSPILQEGKLVGAVTHVLVNDPTRGYGIFIENMLAAAS